ncbi:NAD-dependent epimerase/dehydratase family protein [Nocardia otitidiscaviarum]|uniref:NAD-dependent epimerase/dehydratase family protein n=1 Tax=Nocardia otitidiscaviarum TaxID=1823 RepID=A0A516NXM0_9NOCA|nr:saccharopine dehydrogenase NADP-binding domain-containing protein [Nocardia otitidiscaviarum]MCP9623881.1 saccharopine dehydrogenase NADP-binding domain-containing protein [Nocardia otitidiscaviarum]QDP83660.1 NAD-dependent epimerase/dehydratase family protein [Nocardia otitidiscaviarum]
MTIYAIYGATGHTGRLVTAELLSRGKDVIASGRDPDKLAALDSSGTPGSVTTHTAAVDDAESLRALADTADVIINCAGPFAVTGMPVARAAAEAGCHYIDHSVEVHPVRQLYDTLAETAQRAGITMIPSLSFYGGLGDLLAGAVARGVADIDRITVAYAVTNWKMTTGAVNTARLLFADTERVGFENGELRIGFVEPRSAVFAFPPPVGPRAVIAPVPFPEAFTVPRHTAVRSVEAQLTARTFEEEQAFASEHLDSADRADSEFTIAAQVLGASGSASGTLRGRDLWRAGALASVEAAVRVAGGTVKSGVVSPGEAFDAPEFLGALADRDAFTVDLPTGS